jgi:hypothetical protein
MVSSAIVSAFPATHSHVFVTWHHVRLFPQSVRLPTGNPRQTKYEGEFMSAPFSFAILRSPRAIARTAGWVYLLNFAFAPGMMALRLIRVNEAPIIWLIAKGVNSERLHEQMRMQTT